MKGLKIGDRVRVFSHYGPYKGTVVDVSVRGNTPYGFVDGLIQVKDDTHGKTWYQHPRQCVRLRRKPKPAEERAERWMRIGPEASGYAYNERTNAELDREAAQRVAHVVELKPGEIILDRAALEIAFEKMEYLSKTEHEALIREARAEERRLALIEAFNACAVQDRGEYYPQYNHGVMSCAVAIRKLQAEHAKVGHENGKEQHEQEI